MKIRELLTDKYKLKEIEKNRAFAGLISNYHTVVYYNEAEGAKNWFVNVSANQDQLMNETQSLIENLKNINKVDEVRLVDSYLNIKLPMGFRTNSSADLMDDVLTVVIGYFKANMFKGGDFKNGDPVGPIDLYKVNGALQYLSPMSLTEVEEDVKGQKLKTTSVKQKFIKGMLGALAGAFLGSVIWVILSILDYSGFYVGILTIIFAVLGYKILGKKIGAFGAIFSLIISLVLLFGAIIATYVYNIYMNLKASMTLGDVIRDFMPILAQNPNVEQALKHDLFISLMPVLVVGITYVVSTIKTANSNKSIIKVETK